MSCRLALAALLLLATPALAQVAPRSVPIIGPARVVDGDSIVVAGQMVRLEGLDAPEWDQVCHRGEPPRRYRCGLEATEALRDLIADRPVTCRGAVQPNGGVTDRYGRLLGFCSVGGVEINAWLVENGHALAFFRYSDRYIAHETVARDARRGVWAGPHMPPWEWRALKRADR